MVQEDTYGNYTSDGKQLYYYYEGGLFYSEGYYPIYDNSYSRYTTVYYEDENGGFQEYTGARYSKQSRSETRLDVAKQAVNSLIDTLMANNTADNSDAIEMTFVDFSSHVKSSTTHTDKNNNADTVKGWVSKVRADGGTNWEEALTATKGINYNDSDPTYVIFVSDGNPTFRTSRLGGNDWNRQYQAYGSGNDDYSGRNFRAAQTEADTIVNKKNTFLYTVGIFGDADNMENLSSKAKYYDGKDSAALNAAFADIIKDIQHKVTYGNVTIHDGVTGGVTSTNVNGTAGGFEYTVKDKDGKVVSTWSDADPSGNTLKLKAASYENNNVTWNLGELGEDDTKDYTLVDGYTYTVSFTVWPDQAAYDEAAALNNNPSGWDNVKQQGPVTGADGKKYYTNGTDNANIVKYEDGTFGILTNTSAGVKYHFVNDGVTDIKEQKAGVTNPDPVRLTQTRIAVTKLWNDGLDTSHRPKSGVELKVSDGSNSQTVTLNEGNNWSSNIYIAPALLTTEKRGSTDSQITVKYVNADGTTEDKTYYLLNPGHDYTVTENGSDYHFELRADVRKPMLIDGTLYSAVKNSDGTYEIKKDEAAVISATNDLRGGIDLKKTVTDNSADKSAPEDALFAFKAVLKDAAGNAIVKVNPDDNNQNLWFSRGGKHGVIADGDYIVLNADEEFRFINVPTGVSYDFVEVTADTTLTGTVHLPKSEYDENTGMMTNPADSYDYKAPEGFTYEKSYYSYKGYGVQDDNDAAEKKVKANTASYVTVSNIYDAVTVDTSADTTAVLKKTVSTDGQYDWNTGKKTFDFTIAPDGDAPLAKNEDGKSVTTGTATFNADGTQNVNFGKITYYKEGTYTYTLTEKTDNLGTGWTVKPENGTVTATVTVTKGTDGKLTATVTGAEIKNSYKPLPGTLVTGADTTAIFTKTVNVPADYDWAESKTFTFTISGDPLAKDENGSPVTTGTVTFNKDNAGRALTVDFGTITYDKAGTYEYTITEKDGTGNGWKAEPEKVTIKVNVKDDGGQLVVEKPTPVSITNTYSTTPTELDTSTEAGAVLKKTVNAPAYDWSTAKTFSFTLEAVDGAPVAKTEGSVTFGKDQETKIVDFGKIKYTKKGKYTYKIKETGGTGEGWTAEPAETTATVVVEDQNGKLVVTSVTAGTITNKFTPVTVNTDDEATAVLKKTVKAPDYTWGSKDFSFTLTPENGAPAPERTTAAPTFNNGSETKTIGFGSITFNKVGTYTYTVSEDITNLGKGWTAEPATGKVTITVSANEETGALEASVSKPVEIENTYDLEPAELNTTASTMVQKTVNTDSIYDWTKGAKTFHFTLAAKDGAPVDKTSAELTFKEDGTQTIDFGTIKYDKAGDYAYTISETDADLVNGWKAKDDVSVDVTVHVAKGDNDNLVATVTGATLTNIYEPTTVTLNTNTTAIFQKTVTAAGTAWGPKTFSFTLSSETKDAPMPENAKGTATFNEAGTQDVSFGTITYTKPGTYYYKITEDQSALTSGWTVDPSTGEATVIVTVTDTNGVLSASVKAPAALENKYEPAQSEPVTFSGHKTTTADEGSGAVKPDTFSYTIKDSSGNPVGTFTSGINHGFSATVGGFSAPGTYTYTIGEVKSGAEATEETTAVPVQEAVEPENAETAQETENVPAETEATPEEAVPETEAVTEETQEAAEPETTEAEPAADTAEDEAEAESDAAIVDETTDTVEAETEAVPVEAEAPAEEAENAESQPAEAAAEAAPAEQAEPAVQKQGIEYDPTAYTLTVTVVDGGKGKLVATPALTDANGNPVGSVSFNNHYYLTGTSINLKAHKTLNGRALKEGEFSFQVKDSSGTVVASGTNDADGNVAFGAINYKAGDLTDGKGTFNYTISEVAPADGSALKNVTYDSTEYPVTVTVKDNGDGTMSATADPDYTTTLAEFTNTYTSKGEITIGATKVLDGLSLEDGQFFFTLSGNGVNDTKSNDANGNIAFDKIEYTNAVLNAEGTADLTYTITENVPDPAVNGYTYDSAVKTVNVHLQDNGDGTITATAEYPDGSTFNNSYKAEKTDEVTVSGKKVLEGRALKEGEFSFEISENDEVKQTVTNAADGSFTFDLGTYDTVGVHTYLVKEVAGNLPGVAYDGSFKTVTVTVTDDREGKLHAEVSGDELTFTNTYKSEGSVVITAKKVLEGIGLKEDQFSFTLSGNGVEDTKSNDAEGNITFDEIKFTNEDLTDGKAELEYTLKEVVPEQAAAGYTYDTAEKKVTVKLTDNNDGTISAEVAYPDGNEFRNSYAPSPTDEVTVAGTKVLNGRALKDGEFSFTIKENDETVATAKNAADGSIKFVLGTYDKAGKHVYEVTEDKGSDADITYDGSVKKIEVNVIDDGSGKLSVTVTGDELKFTNTYTEPKKPSTPSKPYTPNTTIRRLFTPFTGDGFNALKWVVGLGVSLATAFAAIMILKNNK